MKVLTRNKHVLKMVQNFNDEDMVILKYWLEEEAIEKAKAGCSQEFCDGIKYIARCIRAVSQTEN